MSNYKLYAEIMPTISNDFGRQSERMMTSALRSSNPNVRLSVDEKDLNRQIDRVGRNAGDRLSNLVGSALQTGGLVAGTALIGKAIKSASDLQAAMGATQQVFGAASKDVLDWSKTTSKSIGVARADALAAAKDFGAFFKAAGLGSREITKLSEGWVELAANISAFADTNPADALAAISSAMRGELDPIQRYVPTISAAVIQQKEFALTGKSVAKELTDQDKILALNALLLDSQANSAGQAELKQNGFSTSLNKTKASMEDLAAQAGESLIPVLTKGLNVFNDIGPVALLAGAGMLTFSNKIQGGFTAAGKVMSNASAAFQLYSEQVTTGGRRIPSAFKAMSAASSGAGSSLLAAVGGPGGLLVAGAAAVSVIAISSIQKASRDAAATAALWADSTKKVAEAIFDNNLSVDENIRKLASKELADKGALKVAKDMGIAYPQLTDAYLNQGDALAKTNTQLDDYIAAQREQISLAALEGRTTDIDLYNQRIALAQGLKDKLSAQSGALKENIQSLKDQEAASQSSATATDGFGQKIDGSKTSVEQFSDSLKKLYGAFGDSQQAQIAATSQWSTLTELARKGKNEFLGASEAALKNRSALLSYADSQQNYITKQMEFIRTTQGEAAATEFAGQAQKKLHDDLVRTMTQMGVSEKQAKAYADQLVGVPKDVVTTVTTPGLKKADDGFIKLKENIDPVTGTKTITVTINGQEKVFNTLREALDYQRALANGVSLETAKGLNAKDLARNKTGKYAFGGYVSGPGGPTADMIPAMLSNGEYVIRAAAAQKIGLENLDYLNAAHFATGGPVNYPYPVDMSKTKTDFPLPEGTSGGNFSGSGGTKAALIALGRWLQSQGYTVSENSAFGGGTPKSGHANGSLHYSDNAIDVNAGSGTSAAEQAKLANVLADAHAAGLRTIFMAAGHYNHLHVDTSNGPSIGQTGGDKNGVQFRLTGSAGASSSGGRTSAGSNVELGRKMAASRGWTGGQFDALNKLWTGESNWRTTAKNPSSGAYGIPQSLPGSKMASAGSDWRTNPATQIKWGMGYIAGRYGSPANAYAKWQARSPHWYSKGGSVKKFAAGGAVGSVGGGPSNSQIDQALKDALHGGISPANLGTLQKTTANRLASFYKGSSYYQKLFKKVTPAQSKSLIANVPAKLRNDFISKYGSNLREYAPLIKAISAELNGLSSGAGPGSTAVSDGYSPSASAIQGFLSGDMSVGFGIGSTGGVNNAKTQLAPGFGFIDPINGSATYRNNYGLPAYAEDSTLASLLGQGYSLEQAKSLYDTYGTAVFNLANLNGTNESLQNDWKTHNDLKWVGDAGYTNVMGSYDLGGKTGTTELSAGTLSMLAGLISSRPAELKVDGTHLAKYEDNAMGRYLTSGI